MYNNILFPQNIINQNTRIDTSDRVEVMLDKYLLDLHHAKTNKRRLHFSIEEELVFTLCLTGVTRYNLCGIDISLGLVFFKILNLAKWEYSNRIFQEQFEFETLIKLPDIFCLKYQDLHLIWTTYDKIKEKHNYTTLKDLATILPNRKKKLITIWQESGLDVLRVLCQFNQLDKLNKLGKESFLANIVRSEINAV